MARARFIGLFLALITLLVYLPVWRHGFVLIDDPDYVTDNHIVQAGLTWAGVKWAFTSLDAGFWHPLTWLSHMLDCELFGLNVGAHHLVNVLFHSANTVLLFLLLFRTTGKQWPGAFVAALFAWHPLHVESVAWVAERKDVLSAFFFLLTLWAYVSYVEKAQGQTVLAGRQALKAKGWYGLVLTFFVCGLMCKTMVVTLPLVLLLLDWWPLKRFPGFSTPDSNPSPVTRHPSTFRRLVLEKLPLLAVAFFFAVVTLRAEKGAGAMPSAIEFPLAGRIANAILSGAWYLRKMFWPVDLAVFYPYPKSFSAWAVAGSGLLLLLISIAVLRTARRPYLAAGWFWCVVTLLPVIGLIQVGTHARADRYTYVPLIGAFVALTWGAAELAARWRLSRLAVGLAGGTILAACILQTENQLRYWQDDVSLFTHALAVTQDNDVARINLGVACEQQDRREDALFQYREALRINPNSSQAHNNLGNLLDEMGRPDEALVHYREAVRLKPDAPLAHDNLGTLLVKLGRFDEAMGQYAEAAHLKPGDPRPHYLIGKAWLRRHQGAEAIAHFRDALRLDPNDYEALTFLARVLASDENPRIRNGAEAVTLAERANELTGGGQPFVLDALAMAYAEAGRFADAQRTIQQAIDLAASAGAKENLPAMQQCLKLYQSGQPYRGAFTNAVEPPVPAK
jgi:tetratricopeptide (TPR) repeat protein